MSTNAKSMSFFNTGALMGTIAGALSCTAMINLFHENWVVASIFGGCAVIFYLVLVWAAWFYNGLEKRIMVILDQLADRYREVDDALVALKKQEDQLKSQRDDADWWKN